MRGFMLNQTRQEDIAMFTEIAGDGPIAGPEEVPFSILAPAFITSELKSAFVIGFMIYIPFVILDLIVASVLMSMGMMMLSPMMISMPFKLMLFVLVDGWTLIINNTVSQRRDAFIGVMPPLPSTVNLASRGDGRFIAASIGFGNIYSLVLCRP